MVESIPAGTISRGWRVAVQEDLKHDGGSRESGGTHRLVALPADLRPLRPSCVYEEWKPTWVAAQSNFVKAHPSWK